MGLIGSALLHVGIVAATFLSFAHTLDLNVQDVPLVPVELVTVTDTTNIAAQSPEPPKPEPQEIAPPQEVTPPPVPEKAEVAPDAPKVVEKKPPPPETKPKPDKPKEDKFDINSIVALLDKKNPPPKSQAGKPGDRSIKGVGSQTAMTADLMASLNSQIQQCWNAPNGVPHAEQLIVTVRFFLNPDGNVVGSPQLVANSLANDPFMRSAEEAALRAVINCAPYKLPVGRYSEWQSVEYTFDPRKLNGMN